MMTRKIHLVRPPMQPLAVCQQAPHVGRVNAGRALASHANAGLASAGLVNVGRANVGRVNSAGLVLANLNNAGLAASKTSLIKYTHSFLGTENISAFFIAVIHFTE